MEKRSTQEEKGACIVGVCAVLKPNQGQTAHEEKKHDPFLKIGLTTVLQNGKTKMDPSGENGFAGHLS